MLKSWKIKSILLVGVIFFALPFFAFASNYSSGQQSNFYLDSSFDKTERGKIEATLHYVSPFAYFYIENDWWNSLKTEEKSAINTKLDKLSKEFDSKIYPTLTSTYGSEWKPGIDKDYHVTILFTQMKEKAAGYFRSLDEYYKIQVPRSNEREMVYLNVTDLDKANTDAYLAHEFTHLITFNQKSRKLGQEEDVWLNELRAEYSPTLLGYDDNYDGSNLGTRINYFIQNPSDSLTEWKGEIRDYGVINIFAQYLVEHYGIKILSLSMASPYTGVASLNYALSQLGIDKDFSQVFSDWTVAVFSNDCSLGKEYCFSKEPLTYLRIAPSLIYLPSTQEASLSLVYAIKEWAGHWYKIIGGGKGIKVEFNSLSQKNFIIPYFVQGTGKTGEVQFLKLDEQGKGTIELPAFGEDHQSLVVIPSISEKDSDFSDKEPFWRFSLDISTFEQQQDDSSQDNNIATSTDNNTDNNTEKPITALTKAELQAKILEIQQKIAQLQIELKKLTNGQEACSSINANLYYGLTNNVQVSCLQAFLKNQGQNIYPEGIISGNFLSLTKEAVVRFQEKYASDILEPIGLTNGTGFVGIKTRQKINQLLEK